MNKTSRRLVENLSPSAAPGPGERPVETHYSMKRVPHHTAKETTIPTTGKT